MAPTAFEAHKRLFYVLRIVRELEPSILIALSLWTYTSALWAARSSSSYSSAMMMPYKSMALDKSAWHFAITKGETGNDGSIWWQEVDRMDVYTSDTLARIDSGELKAWPKFPKWSESTGGVWNDASPDDMWCVVYPAASMSHMSYGPIRTDNGTCGALPAHVTEWCAGWKTSTHVGGGDQFPQGDPGWRCVLPSSWPATEDGRCYSMCLDISGAAPHAPPRQTIDILLLLFLPIIFDLYFILTWINAKAIFAGIHGKVSIWQKLTYALVSLGFFGAGGYLIANTRIIMGVYSPPDYPGAIATALMCCFWGFFFFALAGEDNFPRIHHYLMKPWLVLTMKMVGVKSIGDFGAKHEIDSDVALCFFLVDGYRSAFNNIKRLALAIILVITPLLMTYSEIPGSWASELGNYNRAVGYDPTSFISSQLITIILLVTKVAQALKAPAVKVDYDIAKCTRELDAPPTFKDELMSLLLGSKVVVEKEACHFVGDFKVVDGVCVQKVPENRVVTRPKKASETAKV